MRSALRLDLCEALPRAPGYFHQNEEDIGSLFGYWGASAWT